MWGANKFNKTIKEHFGMLSGVKNYQGILRHFFDAVACQDTSEFPSNALFKKRAGRNKSYPRKFSHQNGLSAIIKNLSDAKFQRLNNTKIRAICESEKPEFKWNIQSECGKDLFCKKVIFATSAEVVQSIIQPLFPAVRFPKFEEHQFSSLTLIVKSSSISLKKFSFAISLQGVFHSVVSGDVLDQLNNSDLKNRSFTFHSRNAKKTEAELIEEALKVIGAGHNDILESKLKPHTLPSYTLDHHQKIKFFKDQISDLGEDIKIIGNWIDGMSIEDCVQTAKKELKNF
jgi:protoporphyrinogen oxidase